MKTLIIYDSKYGKTKEYASAINEMLKDSVLVNINEESFDLDLYDVIVIGSAIYAGNLRPKTKDFITKEKNELLDKKLYLFTVQLNEGQKADEQLKEAYSEELYNHALDTATFSGEIILKKLNFFEKTIIKAIAKKDQDVKIDHIKDLDLDKIEEFVSSISSLK